MKENGKISCLVLWLSSRFPILISDYSNISYFLSEKYPPPLSCVGRWCREVGWSEEGGRG